MSNYIVNRNPAQYGGNQSLFYERSEQSISSVLQKIRAAVSEKTDLTKLFHQILAECGAARQQLARDSHTDRAENFGKRRDSEPMDFLRTTTWLEGAYHDYGQTLMERFHAEMKPMKRDLNAYTSKVRSVEETCLNRHSQFQFEIFEGADLNERRWTLIPDLADIREQFKRVQIDTAEIDAFLQTLPPGGDESSIQFKKSTLQEFKKKAPEEWQRLLMFSSLLKINQIYPSPQKMIRHDGSVQFQGDLQNNKSHYVVATVQIEIDGKLVQLSQYMTWLYRDFKNDTVDRMRSCSKIYMIHQDPLLIDATLQEISRLFEKAVQWDSKTSTVQDLMGRIALFRYVFAHAMPFYRGSAAIAEWIETALYRFHGMEGFRYNSNKSVDLEALTALRLSTFIDNYKHMVAFGPQSSEVKA